MTYNKFMERVLTHLEKYKWETLGIKQDGTYKYQGEYIPKGHILPINIGKSKKDIVKENNVLAYVKKRCKDFIIKDQDLHRFSHHLNSSQMMCYNFFRPYIEADNSPNRDLINLLVAHGIELSLHDEAKCQFEYVNQEQEWKDEGTNFDFYIGSGKKKIYFEIKYTEKDFGGCKDDEYHKNKFEGSYKGFKGGYKKKIMNCPAIKDNIRSKIEFDEMFRKNYQLFRNVIRVTNIETYSVFIYDERNNSIVNQFVNFWENYIADDYKNKVRGITWQDLVKDMESNHGNEFVQKYLG